MYGAGCREAPKGGQAKHRPCWGLLGRVKPAEAEQQETLVPGLPKVLQPGSGGVVAPAGWARYFVQGRGNSSLTRGGALSHPSSCSVCKAPSGVAALCTMAQPSRAVGQNMLQPLSSPQARPHSATDLLGKTPSPHLCLSFPTQL